MPHLLRARARESPERELLRFEGASATYGEIEERSNRLANALTRRGIEPGDRVAIMLPNGLGFPTAWLAVAKTGGIVVPVNVACGARDSTHVLHDSGARLAIAEPERLPLLRRVRPDCPALEAIAGWRESDGTCAGGREEGAEIPDFDLRAEAADASPARSLEGLEPDAPVTIQYTSGTTGLPKGCVLTHEYWLTLARSMCEHVGLGPGDTVLTAQPFCYMDPTWNLVACLLAGAPLVVLPRFSASTFWRSVAENGVTFFYCLGTMPVYLYKQPEDPEVERGHRVRLVLCSGIPAPLHAAFEERWGCPWREAYGTTELGGVLLVPVDDAESVGSGAIGSPAPGYEVRIVGPGGEEVGDGETGEMIVRGPSLMQGYWNDPEATAAWNPDGWARTGDLAFRDARGYYHLVGRLKEMIRRGGENVAAAEVEGVLCEHPSVRAAACVPVPDEERGEEVKAFVQLQPGESSASLPPPALLEFVRGRLAPFKVPRFVEYVEEFPLTPSAKISKPRLLAHKSDPRRRCFDARTGEWG